jgi:hypothetical protein
VKSGVFTFRVTVLTGNWKAYRYVGRMPWYAATTAAGSGSALMFG